MTRERTLLRRTGVPPLLALVILAATIVGVHGSAPTADPGGSPSPRADILRIDGLKQFGPLERPAVVFLHDNHTQALAKNNKDCSACHLADKERLSLKYMRLTDASKQDVMDTYHANCIECHRQTAAVAEKSGPVVCAECHADRSPPSSWKDIGMDKSLHYRHVKAHENKCEACHHEYDPGAKKLFYAKGKEGTCRYCHEEKTVENRISLRLAAHTQCVDCHRKRLAKNLAAGPVVCGGCHDAELQKAIETVTDIPRIKRNQPDVTLVKSVSDPEQNPPPSVRMNVVPFNHIAHEAANDTCRVCHHGSMDACVTCHSLRGAKEGKFVSLETAMHRVESRASCMGCHEVSQREARCAGCHASAPKKDPQDLSACGSCHMPKPEAGNPPLDDKAIAAMMLEARRPAGGTYAEADIPETVTIKPLSRQYDPVKLPHRKIVQTLVGGLKDSKLASTFHRDPGTVCQGCHHRSPAAKKPPACASCHGKPFDELGLSKPGLMAAYHIQCMECHKQMKLEKPIATHCTGCHKEKL